MSDEIPTIRDLIPKKTVTQAIATVAARLPAIGKDSRSPEGYQYRGIEQITEAAGPMLAAEGVVIVPSTRIVSQSPVIGMKEGWTDTIVDVGWKIYGPDGSMIEARTAGIGRDKSDKGSNKAQTQAYKYLLLPLLYVGEKTDDAEAHDTRHESDPAPPPPPSDPAVDAVMQAIKVLDADRRSAVFTWLGLPAAPNAIDVRAAVVALTAPVVDGYLDGLPKLVTDVAGVAELFGGGDVQ